MPVLVGREKGTWMMLANVVPYRGAGQLLRGLRKGVHDHVILTSDQESRRITVQWHR